VIDDLQVEAMRIVISGGGESLLFSSPPELPVRDAKDSLDRIAKADLHVGHLVIGKVSGWQASEPS
jgi:hypothetical protein